MSQTADSITPSSRMLSHFTSPLTVLPFPRRTEEYSEEQGGLLSAFGSRSSAFSIRPFRSFVFFCCYSVRLSLRSTKPRDWLARTSPKWCIVFCVECENLNVHIVRVSKLSLLLMRICHILVYCVFYCDVCGRLVGPFAFNKLID